MQILYEEKAAYHQILKATPLFFLAKNKNLPKNLNSLNLRYMIEPV